MTNTTIETRNAEILNTIESELWRAVDDRNDAEDARFNDEWKREDMMIGKWFNRMVECGKFDKDSANSQEVKDAMAELWTDVLPGIIKAQATVFYDALDDAGVLDDHEEILESFYSSDEADQIFSVKFSEDGDGVKVTADEVFDRIIRDFVENFRDFAENYRD